MKAAVLRETFPGEKRVALIPASVPQLTKAGMQVIVQSGAGEAAGYPDAAYQQRGAELVADRQSALNAADILLQVHCLGANPDAGRQDIEQFRAGLSVIGMCDPLGAPQAIDQIAQTGASLYALELIPRITRAQSMDVLSSMATIAGYRAVLLAASELPKLFPMLMTAAGTITAARVFVIGAGVAGLQAIATAKRLGAIVHAYDVRPACREQVESLGGKFVELQLEAAQSEDQGGYAKQLGEEFYQKQRELMARVVADSDVVITTAAIPGKPSPLLITRAAVEGMAPGSVVIDLAAERGGNCEPSQPDQRVVHQGVVIHGPTNLVSEAPFHASQMYSNNVTRFLLNMVKNGQLVMDMEDEIIRDTCVAHKGQVVHPRIRELLGMPPLTSREDADQSAAADAEPSTGQDGSEPPAAPEASSS
jgi:H+-translocating NAD(P) transhydrogenase subunit alpha